MLGAAYLTLIFAVLGSTLTSALPSQAGSSRLLKRLDDATDSSMILPAKCADVCGRSVKSYSKCITSLTALQADATPCRTQLCDRPHWATINACLSCVVQQGFVTPQEAERELKMVEGLCESVGASAGLVGISVTGKEVDETVMTTLIIQAPQAKRADSNEEATGDDQPKQSHTHSHTKSHTHSRSARPMPTGDRWKV